VVARSWYPALRSSALPAGAIRVCELGPRRLVLYRDHDGHAHALDARCPHLGADLAQGTVTSDGLRCAFHGWTFGGDGACRSAPGHAVPPERCARAYPVEERWRFVWIFNGPAPLFPLPAPDSARRWRSLALPPQQVACHPHVVLANGLDLQHYETVHGMRFEAPPRLSVEAPFEVSVEMCGRPGGRAGRLLSGTTRRPIRARFTTIGGSLAWSTVVSPTEFHVLFTGRPDRLGRCVTQTVFLFPSPPGWRWVQALGLMATLLHHDRRVLDAIDFRPAFVDSDAPLRAFADVVNALGSW
jgi:phenylpropionate dioxygenase-like ring-hydroxylating dioxygenase large terminal subunit